MSPQQRYVLAAAIVLIDLVLFVVPLSGLIVAYLLIVRPPWFPAWVRELYRDDG